MRKAIKKRYFEYTDKDTAFVSCDKELVLLVAEYSIIKCKRELDKEKKETLAKLKETIKEIKKSLSDNS